MLDFSTQSKTVCFSSRCKTFAGQFARNPISRRCAHPEESRNAHKFPAVHLACSQQVLGFINLRMAVPGPLMVHLCHVVSPVDIVSFIKMRPSVQTNIRKH